MTTHPIASSAKEILRLLGAYGIACRDNYDEAYPQFTVLADTIRAAIASHTAQDKAVNGVTVPKAITEEMAEAACNAGDHGWSRDYLQNIWDAMIAASPQLPVAQPSTGQAIAVELKPLTDKQIEDGWNDTFSTNNPFCPCDLRSFTKAVRWAERSLAAPSQGAKQ